MESLEQKKWYDKTWVVVVLCIVFFPVGLYALWKNSLIKTGWKIAVTIIIGLIVIANIGGNDKKTDSSTTENITTEDKTESKPQDEVKSNWYYSEDADKMTNEKRYFASCVSTNEIEFEFPYNGGSSFTLTVRQMGQGNEIVLQVSKGQFMTSFSSSENIRAKFDEEQPLTFSYNSASDGSMDVIFLENSSKFLSNLRKAKKLMIEAPFFNAGRQHIEFDVAGLNWDK